MQTTSRGVFALALGALFAVACAKEEPLPPAQNSEYQGDGGPSGVGPGGTVTNPPDGGVPAGDAAPAGDAGANPGLDVVDRSETGVRDASGGADVDTDVRPPFPPDDTGVRDASGAQDAPEPRDFPPPEDAFAPPDL